MTLHAYLGLISSALSTTHASLHAHIKHTYFNKAPINTNPSRDLDSWQGIVCNFRESKSAIGCGIPFVPKKGSGFGVFDNDVAFFCFVLHPSEHTALNSY